MENTNTETRIAQIGIVIEDRQAVNKINEILHSYADYIIGRMGIPYRAQGISIISVVLDAPQSISSSIAGKIGMISGVQVKTIYSKILTNKEAKND